ncbi:hypothetical protein [Spongiactinospora sp. TRM90649]|uniref:protein kinase domain-containing protein n=1 Tax=Spongiactinospora sp. TRM90649 TaxID=3031114 RepID=UPI0023F61FF3|nr:hypothetical protein [Spongiactinospora sp. TRM90649]MDF5751202.1 hypothetical protein [Spongiactinospora sp. TRM90649]
MPPPTPPPTPPPPIAPTDFERRLLALIRDSADEETCPSLIEASAEARTLGTIRFLRGVLDHAAEHEAARRPGSFADACDAALRALLTRAPHDPARPAVAGLLALICLNVRLLERRFDSPDRARYHETDAYCRELFTLAPVGEAFHAVYRPDEGTEFERDRWAALDPATFAYHRAGTTSVILRATGRTPRDESGAFDELAVKCVLFPWNKLSAIAQATNAYAEIYGGRRASAVVVHPIASTDRWVLLPFQEGRTLAERLDELEGREQPPSVAERLAVCAELSVGLTAALHRLAAERPVDASTGSERQHLDLSPGNVILAQGTGEVRLIDLGPNHLYSRQIGIPEHDDSVYVAPEVKNKGRSLSSDAYSLGIILIQAVCGHAPRDGRAPDVVWRISPDLGRALEDLIEEDPRRRLLLLPEGPLRFDVLGAFLDEAVELAGHEPDAARSRARRVLARVLPSSSEVSTQYQRWRLSRRSVTGGRNHSYLLLFAFVATACWWFILAKTALFNLDELVTGEWGGLPSGMPLAADVIALTQGLLAAKYYQTILARLTARGVPGRLAPLTEVSIRLMTCVALLINIVPLFYRPDLWAWGAAAGAYLVTACNGLTLLLTTRMYQAGHDAGLSTIPADARVRGRGYEQWWWTMLLYALAVTVIAAGLSAGFLRDLWAYVFGLVAVSVGIHYLSKFVAAGMGVRAELARAFAAGERVAILTARGTTPPGVRWPPRMVP